jgi:hypothetical protein
MNLAEPFQSLINISVEAYAFTVLQLCTPKISLFSEKKLKTFHSLYNHHIVTVTAEEGYIGRG